MFVFMRLYDQSNWKSGWKWNNRSHRFDIGLYMDTNIVNIKVFQYDDVFMYYATPK